MVDYSKWDAPEVSDDEGEPPKDGSLSSHQVAQEVAGVIIFTLYPTKKTPLGPPAYMWFYVLFPFQGEEEEFIATFQEYAVNLNHGRLGIIPANVSVRKLLVDEGEALRTSLAVSTGLVPVTKALMVRQAIVEATGDPMLSGARRHAGTRQPRGLREQWPLVKGQHGSRVGWVGLTGTGKGKA